MRPAKVGGSGYPAWYTVEVTCTRRQLGLALLAASCSRRGCGPDERVAELEGAAVEAITVHEGVVVAVGGGARGRMWTVSPEGNVVERLDRLAHPRDVIVVHDRWVVASDGGVVAMPRTGAERESWTERPAWRLAAGAAVCWIERETSAIWRWGGEGPVRVIEGRGVHAQGFAVAGSRVLWTAADALWDTEVTGSTPRLLAQIPGAGDVAVLDHRLFAVATPDGLIRHPDGGKIIEAQTPASLSAAGGWLAFGAVDGVVAVGTPGSLRVPTTAKAVATDGRRIWWVDRGDVLWRRSLSS